MSLGNVEGQQDGNIGGDGNGDDSGVSVGDIDVDEVESREKAEYCCIIYLRRPCT